MRKAITLITAAMFGAGGVAAQPPVVVTAAPFKVVSYADLNISSSAGQTRLVNRIRAAASDLCLENNREEVKVAAARRACFDTAYNGGLSQMSLAIAGRPNSALATATLVISTR
jgi:UrcA family protein